MPFEEQSNLVMLLAQGLVYGVYAVHVLPGAIGGPGPGVAEFGPLLFVAVGVLVALAILGHVLAALVAPSEAGAFDERDQLIETRADALSGYVLAAGAFGVLILILREASPFWTAHALLGAMIASEMTKGVLRAVAYRRGV